MSENFKYIDHESRYVSPDATIVDVVIGKGAKIFRFVEIKRGEVGIFAAIGDNSVLLNCRIGDHVNINRRNDLHRVEIGSQSYTGMNCVMRSCSIGKFCSISWNVSIGGKNHDLSLLTTSPLWRFKRMGKEGATLGSKGVDFGAAEVCEIGNDVWIGSNAVILRNVKIGDGAVVGAGAVVTKDVPPYAIVAGVPAKVLRFRFPSLVVEHLLRLKWWEWSDETINQNLELIYNTHVDAESLTKLENVSSGG